jgi:hypothetical protein
LLISAVARVMVAATILLLSHLFLSLTLRTLAAQWLRCKSPFHQTYVLF